MPDCSAASMVILSPTGQALSYTVNPYHVLQVRHDATLSEIRQNYRRLALWYHPGRAKATIVDEIELQRRAQVFEILAASYETLVDYRDAYNACLHSLDHPPLKGEIHVGGKRMMVLGSMDEDYEVVPTLLRASSDESEDDENEREQAFRHENTHCMKDSPLELLYRSRHYQAFTDPYDVFEKVCGHAVFARPNQRRHNKWIVLDGETATTAPRPAIWTGSTVKRRDGTVVSFTSRAHFNRKVTKTETTTVDEDGISHVHIQVTSKQVPDDQYTSVPKSICCRSSMEDALIEESSLCSWPEMASPYSWLFPAEDRDV